MVVVLYNSGQWSMGVISVMNTVLDGSGAGWQWCMGVISMTVVVLDGNGAWL
jgi:hypothetical protein